MDTDLLAELMGRRLAVLTALRDMSRRQIELVSGSETTALLKLLADKQTLIDELSRTDRRLDPFRDQDPDSRRWRSLEDRRRCQQQAQDCAALLGEIILLEQHSATDLQRRRDQVAQRMHGAHSADRARHAYSGGVGAIRGGLDITSDS